MKQNWQIQKANYENKSQSRAIEYMSTEQALAAEIERNVREEVAAGSLLAEQRQV